MAPNQDVAKAPGHTVDTRQVDKRIYALDSLRGLAAIYVVFFHLFLVPHPNPVIPSPTATHVVMFGGTGVFLFFVISGFSLCMTMPRHKRAARPLMSYAVSRMFRIAPVFVFMLVVSVFRDGWAFGAFPSAANVLLNLSFLFNLVPDHQTGIVWASWTIGVEMLFYAVFPVLYRSDIAVQITSALLALAAFTVVDGYAPGYFYWSLLGYFPLFVIGMLAFDIYAALKDDARRREIGAGLIIVGFAVLLTCMLVSGAEKAVHLRNAIGIGYAALLVGCVLRSPVMLNRRALTFFGRISYPLYLVHAPVIYACSGLFERITVRFPVSVSYLVCAAVTFAIAMPCAYLVQICVADPGVGLGKRMLRWLNGGAEHRLPTWRGT